MNLINKFFLFGFPITIIKLDKNSYNKKSITSTIEKNFKISPKRNSWDSFSVLHHSYDDELNPKYHKVNFDSLVPIYKKGIETFLSTTDLLAHCDYSFQIVNYTCFGESQYMAAHSHPEVDFVGMHYIQFDKKNHTPVVFDNTLPHKDYIRLIRPDLEKILSPTKSSNSWISQAWMPEIQEDDFCFFPGYIKHHVDPQKSKKKRRIAIVLNITLKKKDVTK